MTVTQGIKLTLMPLCEQNDYEVRKSRDIPYIIYGIPLKRQYFVKIS